MNEKKIDHVSDDPADVLPGTDAMSYERRVRRKIDCVILPMVSVILFHEICEVLTAYK